MGIANLFRKKKNLREDIDIAGNWLIEAMRSSGYSLDYSIESIKEIERFFDENMESGKPKENGLLFDGIGKKMFAIGSYISLILYKNHGWEIITNDNDFEGEINIELTKKGNIIFPVQKVLKRFTNGQEDNLYSYIRIIENK
jgi:hypothetical protein